MILGVAQVVVNVRDLDGAARELLDASYTQTFAERGLPNHGAKAPFQASARAALDMAHFTPPRPAPAVELTAYAGDPPGGAAAYRLEHEDGVPVRAVVDAVDPAASARFWREGLGFEHAGEGLLRSRAMLPAWRLEVLLRPADGLTAPTTVDAEGCVLLTVLTTDARAELERGGLKDLARRSSEVWEEPVAGRNLRVALVEGPSGELVELLQLPPGAGTLNT
jgi:hypothetical protein